MERQAFFATAAGIAAAAATLGTALAAPTPRPLRPDAASERNLRRVRQRLERLIDQLQHDQRDYGGHREKALDLMQRARAELMAGEQFEHSHDRGTT
ncbi:MAG: hypothetical protein GIW99_02430 [Candidatus Eremiobacteraeota bacterium]|nr:hypothetical protein [Candidatus Eremiobacteraeota bacterium]MBC5826532.1 hypothetical protein [Candidatus Eremiobacteraeota bacterium]